MAKSKKQQGPEPDLTLMEILQTFALILTIVVVFGFMIFMFQYLTAEDKIIDFKGVDITDKQLKDLTEHIPEGRFIVCSTETEDINCAIGDKFNLKEEDGDGNKK